MPKNNCSARPTVNRLLAAITLSQQDSRQSHRTPRTGIHRQRTNLPERPLRNQQNTANRPFAGNSDLRQIIESQPIQFRTRHQSDRRFPATQSLSAFSGQIEPKIEPALPRSVQKAPNQGPCVQITDGRDAQASSLSDPVSSNIVNRLTGFKPFPRAMLQDRDPSASAVLVPRWFFPS